MSQHILEALLEEQSRSIENVKTACIKKYGTSVLSNATGSIYNETLKTWFCPAFWDTILCWPDTPANSTTAIACPKYVTGLVKSMNNATRTCTENATWFFNEEFNDYWTNYTQCYDSPTPTVVVKMNETHPSRIIEQYFPLVKTISRTGYRVSFCTLVVAFNIMLAFRKLHCPRNKLHMHLFASFILRAFFFLLKDQLFVEGVALSSNLKYQNGSSIFVVDAESNNWTCKFVISLWQYFMTANYSWILMEGLYLYNLIFRALFADTHRSIIHYIILGWGLPLLVVTPWVAVRIFIEDDYCWTTYEKNSLTLLIIRIPIAISIFINLILFINISIVLFSKLRSPVNEETRRYQKWAKSTLVLVPLFGIHYAVFLLMGYSVNGSEIVEFIWLIGDQLFSSFQGFFVAVLYCFLNGEVKSELKPHIHILLTYCATSTCLKYCFPCRQKYLSSARTRSSVCTTMSCSSLYTNGINPRYSRTRWDMFQKTKHPITVVDKNKEHICRSSIRSWHDVPPRWNIKIQNRDGMGDLASANPLCKFSSNENVAINKAQETSLCTVHKQERSQSDTHLLEERMRMINDNK